MVLPINGQSLDCLEWFGLVQTICYCNIDFYLLYLCMRYGVDAIDKIVELKSWTQKQKLDELLRIDCAMYTNLGINSTQTEKELIKRRSRAIYRRIKKVNEYKGTLFLEAMDV